METCFDGGAASAGSCLPQAFVLPPVLAAAAGVAVAGTAVLICTGLTVGAGVAVAGGALGAAGAVVGAAVGAAVWPAQAARSAVAPAPATARSPRRLILRETTFKESRMDRFIRVSLPSICSITRRRVSSFIAWQPPRQPGSP